MVIQFCGYDYKVITNYSYGRLVEMCCEHYNTERVSGKVFVNWLIDNNYISKIESS